jgi:hypothetical protein
VNVPSGSHRTTVRGGQRCTESGSTRPPTTAHRTGSRETRPSTFSSNDADGPRWCATTIGTSISVRSSPSTSRKVSTPPSDEPTTTPCGRGWAVPRWAVRLGGAAVTARPVQYAWAGRRRVGRGHTDALRHVRTAVVLAPLWGCGRPRPHLCEEESVRYYRTCVRRCGCLAPVGRSRPRARR